MHLSRSCYYTSRTCACRVQIIFQRRNQHGRHPKMSYKLYAKDYDDAPEVPILRLNDDMVALLKMQISSLQKQGKTLAQIADLIEISIDGTTLTMEGEEHTLDARTEAAPVEVFQVTEKGFELVGLNKKKYSVKRKMTEQVRMEVKDKSRQEEDKRNSRQYVLPLLGRLILEN
jgi:hypothetical protein